MIYLARYHIKLDAILICNYVKVRIEQTRIQEFLTLAEELGIKGLAEEPNLTKNKCPGLAEMEAGGGAREPELAEGVSEEPRKQDRTLERNTQEPEAARRSNQEEPLEQGQVDIKLKSLDFPVTMRVKFRNNDEQKRDLHRH